MTLRSDVEASLDFTITPKIGSQIDWAIGVASEDAKYYSKVTWTTAPPPIIAAQIVKCVSRWIRNPEGFSSDKVGERSVGRNLSLGELHSTPTFLSNERKILEGYVASLASGSGGFTSVPSYSGQALRGHRGTLYFDNSL